MEQGKRSQAGISGLAYTLCKAMNWVTHRLLRWLAGVIGSIGLAVALVYLFCPKPDLVAFTGYSKAYFDRDGKLLRITLADDDRYRLYQPLDNIAVDLVNATV